MREADELRAQLSLKHSQYGELQGKCEEMREQRRELEEQIRGVKREIAAISQMNKETMQ